MKINCKNLAALCAGISGTVAAHAQEHPPVSSAHPQKPNIVFFLADDLGWMDIACYGSRFHETPNIDRLAREGVRFTNAYAACPVSSPTRGSLMTGRYPANTGMTDFLKGRKNFPFQRLLNNPNKQFLPAGEQTLAETLRDNGYKTAIVGKWHLGADEHNPLAYGFDEHIPYGYNVGWPLDYYAPFRLNGFNGEEGEYLTDRMTKEAVEYIERHRDQPFFLYMSHFAVHDPIQGRKDLVEKYRRKLSSMPPPDGEPYILEGNPDDEIPLTRQQLDSLLHTPGYENEYRVLPDRTVKIKQFQDNVEFAAMVESMDESLGIIRDKLVELGIADNTIIIFYSDNGGMAGANLGNPTRVVPPDKLDEYFSTSNLPLRGAKGWLYEGGIRVPMIVYQPGVSAVGKTCDVPVSSPDFYPTILEMVNAGMPAGKICDGISILPLVKGRKRLEDRALYWYFPHYSNHGMQSPGAAIRYGDYKLIEYFENGTVQLFDLKRDPGEQNNIASSKPRKAGELLGMLRQWQRSAGTQTMRLNPDYVPLEH